MCIASSLSMLLDKLTFLKQNASVKQSPLPRSKHVCIEGSTGNWQYSQYRRGLSKFRMPLISSPSGAVCVQVPAEK